MKPLLILALCLALAGCTPETPEQIAAREAQNIKECAPEIITQTPDGVTLWVTHCAATYSRAVYFSTSGTQYTERHGKATVSVEVPNTVKAHD